MTEVASRELRNNTRALLDRVAGGETITITIEGRPVAELRTVARRQRFVTREQFLAVVLRQADAALSDELRYLAPDTTDDLTW